MVGIETKEGLEIGTYIEEKHDDCLICRIKKENTIPAVKRRRVRQPRRSRAAFAVDLLSSPALKEFSSLGVWVKAVHDAWWWRARPRAARTTLYSR